MIGGKFNGLMISGLGFGYFSGDSLDLAAGVKVIRIAGIKLAGNDGGGEGFSRFLLLAQDESKTALCPVIGRINFNQAAQFFFGGGGIIKQPFNQQLSQICIVGIKHRAITQEIQRGLMTFGFRQ